MKITVTDENTINHEIEISHDVDGNIFFKDNDIYYYLTISLTDDVELVKIEDFNNLISVNANIKYNTIKNTLSDKSLKGKIINQITKKENNDEYFDEDVIDINNLKYHPEDKNHYIENNNTENSDESDTEEYEVKFSFSKNAETDAIKCITKTLDVPANYDTFIIDDFNKATLTTIRCNEVSDYRISITTLGLINLNIIGTKTKSYKVIFKGMDLYCEKLTLGVSQFL